MSQAAGACALTQGEVRSAVARKVKSRRWSMVWQVGWEKALLIGRHWRPDSYKMRVQL